MAFISSFGGSRLKVQEAKVCDVGARHAPVMMAKGKNSKYRSAPMQQPNQMGPEIPEDGTPVFSVFVRSTEGARIWYPCGGVQGDKRAKGLVEASKGNIGKALYQSALDRGMAQTIYRDGSRFADQAIRLFPALKKHKENLEFGYRISAAGMETTKTKVVEPDMALPFLKWAQKKLSERFGN